MKLFKQAFLAAAFGISALLFASGANAVVVNYDLNDGTITGTADTAAGQVYTSSTIAIGEDINEGSGFQPLHIEIDFLPGQDLILEELSSGMALEDEELASVTLNVSYNGPFPTFADDPQVWDITVSLSGVTGGPTLTDHDYTIQIDCLNDGNGCDGQGFSIDLLFADFDLTDDIIKFTDLEIWIEPSDGGGTACGGPCADDWTVDSVAFVFTGNSVSIPEPATLALFGIGLAGFGVLARRRRLRQDHAA